MSIWLSSDLHLGHNKDFIWSARGFSSVEEMNQTIINNWNELVQPEDTVYILGDVIMGKTEETILLFDQLQGNKIVIAGNHDSALRRTMLEERGIKVVDAMWLTFRKQRFFLSHYPTLTANNDADKPIQQRIINLCGHTHTTNPFADWPNGFFNYHVEMDAHECKPILLEDIIQQIKEKLYK